MSDPASGAKVTRLFDPAKEIHYALSEEAELELRMIFQAMGTISQLLDVQPNRPGPDILPEQLAPIFHSFGKHGERIVAEMRSRFPKAQGRKSA